MTIHLIDTSGAISASHIAGIRAQVRIGDRIICFDTEPHGDLTIESQTQIDHYRLRGGAGTDLTSTFALLGNTDEPIRCYTDGYFADGYAYASPAIQASYPYRAGTFELILI